MMSAVENLQMHDKVYFVLNINLYMEVYVICEIVKIQKQIKVMHVHSIKIIDALMQHDMAIKLCLEFVR
jgi:hypothetical protein